MDFKKFVSDKINYFATHFRRRAVLLDANGEPLYEINLSFNELSDQYMAIMDEMENSTNQMDKSTMKLGDFEGGMIKISDNDLQPLWEELCSSYNLCFNLQDQNITDQTLLKIAQLYEEGKCCFRRLNFSGNNKITQIGAVRLAQALKENENLRQINFHDITLGTHGANRVIELIAQGCLTSFDIGLIGNSSLKYLAAILDARHKLENVCFGEDESDPWKEDGKGQFQKVLRRGEFSKQILSTNLYPNNPVKHWDLINELNILCKKRRNLKVNERQNEFKVAALNPDHSKYYDPQNHSVNAYKFSVKSYLTNVFRSELDEALYFLQKERRNSLREQAIFEITKQPINKLILEDICTADGSIVVLAKYLLNKIQDKKQQKEEV